MAESFELTTPVTQDALTDYKVYSLLIHVDQSLIVAEAIDNRGAIYNHRWTGTEAWTLIVALNKANLSTKSLQRRVLELMRDAGAFAGDGAIAGTPD